MPKKTNEPQVEVEGDADEEEEQMPEEWADLPPAKQKMKIIMAACRLMFLGTALVLIFSDPLVDNLSAIGNRVGVPPFYVAFVLAPFASNASELLAAYNYAIKKTRRDITTSLATLVGAACMNNTFCLAIFYALIYCKGLAWQFTAETIAIVLVQWIIGAIAILKKTHTVPMGIVIFACYPFCLFVVYFLENVCGLD